VEARRVALLGDNSYHVVEAIQREVPSGAQIYTMDGRMSFYLSGYEVKSGSYPYEWDDLAGFDYMVAAPWGPGVYQTLGQADSPVPVALKNGDPRLQVIEHAGEFTLYEVMLDE
jgi:hypothetical protein